MLSRKESRLNAVSNSQRENETQTRILMVFFVCLFPFFSFLLLLLFFCLFSLVSSLYFVVISSPTTGALRSVFLISLVMLWFDVHALLHLCLICVHAGGGSWGAVLRVAVPKRCVPQLQLVRRLLCSRSRRCVEVKPFPE